MPIKKNTKASSPLKNSGSPARIATRPRSSAPKPTSNGNNLTKKEGVALSKESKSILKGTEEMDMLKPKGNMPNLIEAFGGDDIIDMQGSGKSEVRAGDGDDVVEFGGDPKSKKNHQLKIDGGKGNDAVFAGSDSRAARPFHILDEKGKTVAKNGEGGDKAQVKNVETAIVGNTVYGGDGDDKIVSDFQGESDVKLVETHNIDGGKGNDDITVRTGDKGKSEVNILPKEGDNSVKFEGGKADDQVFYSSIRGYDPKAEGSDSLSFQGGEGNDQLSIASQNYSLTDKEGKVLSKLGNGSDKISVDGFEKIMINGEALEL